MDRLRHGEGVALELVGEPGIGKTTVLDVLCRRATERGCLVLRGRAGQFERDAPFHVFVEALDDFLGSSAQRLLEPLPPAVTVELGRIFPTLSDLADTRQPALDTERYHAHRAVHSLLRLLAKRTPVVLGLDDVHWVDDASQELVSFLLRSPPRAPLLLALAYRPAQAQAPLVELMKQAVADDACQRLEIGPLTRVEADKLLGAALPDPELRSRAFKVAGGNPFYLGQLAAHPDLIAMTPTARSQADGVPASVLASIRGELSTLGHETRVVLQGAAIVGDPFEPQHAAAGAAIGLTETLRHLDELHRRELVRPSESSRRFQFRHPLVRRAVYEGAPAGWRIGAHARVAARLRQEGAPPTILAPHLEAAAQPGDEPAIATLAEAGYRASSRAPASAARWLGSARQLIPAGPENDERKLGLLVSMASALGAAGRLEESRDAMREALALIPGDAPKGRVKAAVGCATMEFLLGRKQVGERLLVDTLASLGDKTSPEAAEITFALGMINGFDSEHDAARAWCQQTLDISQRRGLSALEAGATVLLAYRDVRLGNIAASTALVRRAVRIIDSLSDAEIAERPEALAWLATTEFPLEHFESALTHAERGLTIARETGQGRWHTQFAAIRLYTFLFWGRIAEATQACDDVIEMARLTGDRQFQVIALTGAVAAMTSAGNLGQALSASDRLLELIGPATGRSVDIVSVVAYVYMARCLLAAGQASASRQMCLDGCGGEDLPLVDPRFKPVAYHDLTLADIALGDLESADRWAKRAETVAEQLGLASLHGVAHHARASVLLARGDAVDAAQTALVAAQASAQADIRLDEGRALCLAGRAMAETGKRDTAVPALARAVELLDGCEAMHLRDEAARELRKLGRHVSRPGRRGVGQTGATALSAREWEIAELVATGKTNKEIATELHLSVYTVENHMRSVFAKLGVSKRAAVATRLAESQM